MAKPMIHAASSVKRFGGCCEDYLAIHDFMDSPKASHASMKFRVIFHSAFGVFLVERVFGHTLTNSDGKAVSVRDIAEQHVLDDLGFIPSLDDYLTHMEIQPWMAGAKKGLKNMKIVD